MDGFAGFLKVVRKLVGTLVTVMLAVLVVIVLAAVFYRYVLSDSITWSSEAARYLCVWIGFLSASLIMNERGHIGLDFIINMVSRPLRRSARLISDAAVLIFLLVVIQQGVRLAVFQMDQHSPAIQMSMVWPYASVPVSALLMALEALYLVLNDIIKLKRPEDEWNGETL